VSDRRYQRLEALRAEAAEQSGLPVDHDVVISLAALRLSREEIVTRLVDGGNDPARLSESLQNVSDAIARICPPPMQTVELMIVSRAEVQKCPECAHEFPVQKISESLEERRAKARLEHSTPASPPATEESRGRKTPQIEPTASASPLEGKSKPAPRPYHETMQRGSVLIPW
jgi:hypothetical protein